MSWTLVGLVAAGGAIGSVIRFLLGYKVSQMVVSSFPWGTFLVNVIGSFLIGVMVELLSTKWQISNEIKTMIIVGVFGGLTTFSTFSFEFINLMEGKMIGLALSYWIGSIVAGGLAVVAGLYLVRGIA